ncbi:MAG: tRNA (guanosine(46)-N7)-methyltransferase TrmB [Gammaproteobacteria bacterium]|nr:tRNA (guanosine(46)-N7)-methyltransferase TrmB [Gammaproteobacteria bacterium]
MSLNLNAHSHTLRTFVRRQGRITPAQRRALLAHRDFLIDDDHGGLLRARKIFGRQAPLWVEIGFGNGVTLAALAANKPDHDFLGIEVHKPGVGRLLLAMEKQQLRNIRIAEADAMEFVERRIAETSVSRILILFPDPWPKQRQRKRRLLQPTFARTLAHKLVPGGVLHLATDWPEYAGQMLAVLEDIPTLRNCSGRGQYARAPDYRIPTRFELRGLRLGHPVRDLLFERI